MWVILFALLFGLSTASRPSDQSTCDYYASLRYGTSNSETQLKLVEDIITLAFGGRFNLSDVPFEITGIFNPGQLGNLPVDLRPWFNGSIPSTNLNNQPVGIDWLDDGGLDPLYDYLANTTDRVVLHNGTNQYRLFNHFLTAFSHVFGCSHPYQGPGVSFLSLAYVHKYMNLNYTDLGHFIDQLSRSAAYFGFSDQDANTLSTNLNSQYNVRCSPPINIPPLGPQLLSLCQASSCPLAEPDPDCGPYENLTAQGLSGPPNASSTGAPTTSAAPNPTTIVNIVAPTSATPTPTPSHSSGALGPGGIAGTVIGVITGVLLIVTAIILYFRRKNKAAAAAQGANPYHPTPTHSHHSPMAPHITYVPSHSPMMQHVTYIPTSTSPHQQPGSYVPANSAPQQPAPYIPSHSPSQQPPPNNAPATSGPQQPPTSQAPTTNAPTQQSSYMPSSNDQMMMHIPHSSYNPSSPPPRNPHRQI